MPFNGGGTIEYQTVEPDTGEVVSSRATILLDYPLWGHAATLKTRGFLLPIIDSLRSQDPDGTNGRLQAVIDYWKTAPVADGNIQAVVDQEEY